MNKPRIWAILAALVLAMTATLAVGCGDDDDDEGGGGGGGGQPELIEEGQLLVGVDTPFPPFEIGQPPDITGYDIDVLNEIANRLNLEPTYRDTGFETIFTDLANGRFDIVAAATTILPDREQTVDFSDPYYLTPQSLLVREGETEIRTADDLGGATVGAQDGTTGEFYAQDETDASDVRGYPEGPDAINALRSDQVDAVIIDFAVGQDAVQKAQGVEIAQRIVTNELYGFPTAEDNDALREQVNEALAEMKEDGTLERLYQKYFKEAPPQSVLEGTHEPE
jgi:polar amino acid transport system substrate-binding protein